MAEEVVEVDLSKEAGVPTEEEKQEIPEIEGLISFDQLVMNFLQQHATAKEEYI